MLHPKNEVSQKPLGMLVFYCCPILIPKHRILSSSSSNYMEPTGSIYYIFICTKRIFKTRQNLNENSSISRFRFMETLKLYILEFSAFNNEQRISSPMECYVGTGGTYAICKIWNLSIIFKVLIKIFWEVCISVAMTSH